LVVYNRVPKTGSEGLIVALAQAATVSQQQEAAEATAVKRRINMFGVPFTGFHNLGNTYNGKYVLHPSYKWNKAIPDTMIDGFCAHFKELATHGNSVYSLHTPFLDFNSVCPKSDLSNRTIFINQLRAPVARVISWQLFLQKCVCETHMGRCADITESWSAHLVEVRRKGEHAGTGAIHSHTRSKFLEHVLSYFAKQKERAVDLGWSGLEQEGYCAMQANGLIDLLLDYADDLNVYTSYFCGLSGTAGKRHFCGVATTSKEALQLAKENMVKHVMLRHI
jgi:hypothetical protein